MDQMGPPETEQNNLFVPKPNCIGSSLSVGAPSIPSSPFPRPLSSPPRLSFQDSTAQSSDWRVANDPLDTQFLQQVLSEYGYSDLNVQTNLTDNSQFFNPSTFGGQTQATYPAASTSRQDLGIVPSYNNLGTELGDFEFQNSSLPVAESPALLPNHSSLSSPAPLSTTTSKSEKSKRTADAGPKKLPRPPNSWILYRSDKISEMKALKHGLAQSVLSKEIASRWHNEVPDVKKEYEKKAEIMKTEHAAKYPDYKYNPKRRKPAENKKAGQKSGSKRSLNDEGLGPKATKKRKNTASSAVSNGPGQPGQIAEVSAPDLLLPSALESELFSTYPLLGQLAAAQELQSQPQRQAQGLNAGQTMPGYQFTGYQDSPGAALMNNPYDELWRQEGSHQHSQYLAFPATSFPSQTPQLQQDMMDFASLDPQLQFDGQMTSGTFPAWLAPSSQPPMGSQSPYTQFSNPYGSYALPGSSNFGEPIVVDNSWSGLTTNNQVRDRAQDHQVTSELNPGSLGNYSNGFLNHQHQQTSQPASNLGIQMAPPLSLGGGIEMGQQLPPNLFDNIAKSDLNS